MSALSYSDVALEYLREHAIDPAVAASAGVTEDRGALAFPCRDGDGRPTTRRRLLNGRGPKVVGEAGHPLGVTYWLPREPPAKADFVIVCEAEGDELAAVSAIVAGGEGVRLGCCAAPSRAWFLPRVHPCPSSVSSQR